MEEHIAQARKEDKEMRSNRVSKSKKTKKEKDGKSKSQDKKKKAKIEPEDADNKVWQMKMQ